MGDNLIKITASDRSGNIGRASIKVTRLPETIPPTVNSTTPESNAVDVSVNTTVTATFSEEIDPSTINTSSFRLVDGTGNPIVGSVTYLDKIAYFTPYGDLDYSMPYSATITTAVKDLSGNSMGVDYTWSFTTGATPDTTPPTVIQEYPINMSVCIDIDTSVSATFSEAIDTSTIGLSSFSLVDGSGNSIDGFFTYSGTRTTFHPRNNLSYSATYTATITTAVKDLSGNNMAADYTWTFSTPTPGTGTWVSTSTTDAPIARSDHVAVWTGTEMLIWGGRSASNQTTNSGGRYNPATDTWQPTSLIDAPSGRSFHTAVWTGTEMIVWGGYAGGSISNTGGRYNPTTDTWQPTSTIGAPSPRRWHTAVWTGTEMLIWGGDGGGSTLNSGARYDPATDTWQPISAVGAPAARERHTAIWTGSEMIVWDGLPYFVGGGTGGRYNPTTDTWQPTSTIGAPLARYWHTAVWTGTEMIVWGVDNTGGRYDPVTDTWLATSTECAPSGRSQTTGIWTGTEMIVWGGFGYSYSTLFNTGGQYYPLTDSWLLTNFFGAPSERSAHTAVWTGTEMIIWGGYGNGYLNTGGRYEP
jgi:N-acetylneuraminic acid mutarotase